MKQPLLLGIDAGGSATVAVLARGAAIERRVVGDPANASVRGVIAAVAAIVASAQAAASAGHPQAICVGAAGAGRQEIADAIRAALQAAFPAAAVVVEDDTRIALRAGVAAGPGIVLIAGTGAVAYGEHGERRARVGGAGYLLGDEGSAFAIGLAACKLLARTLDGRARADETTELVNRGLHAADRDGLLAAIYDAPLDVARIAALAVPIVAFAGKGNRASTKIVQAASLDLADLVKSAAQQLDLIDRSPPVVLAGGLLKSNSLLTFLLETRIAGDLPGAQIVRHDVDPALGALRLAATLVATT